MRICSLVPGATEVVVRLGLADSLVGISHECDYPAAIRHVPVMVRAAIDSERSDSAGIDRQVTALVSSGQPMYRVDESALAQARPDIILTQDVCGVCAVTPPELERAIQSLSRKPQLLTLGPHSLADVLNDVERIGNALDVSAQARDLAYSLRTRIAAVRERSTPHSSPRVVCLEWLDPLYVGGHWVPEMVDAGGGSDVLGHAGQPSRQVTMDEIREAAPDILIVMPCGFSPARAVTEASALCRQKAAYADLLLSAGRTYVVDAGSYFSRPGPRLVDGVELMADICSGTTARADRPAEAVRQLTADVCRMSEPL
ncbi:MAG TPA: cobalamin-binding protein [Nitrospira sp.]|nr:cobalamin-binding protein [Nitrospira sp.]